MQEALLGFQNTAPSENILAACHKPHIANA